VLESGGAIGAAYLGVGVGTAILSLRLTPLALAVALRRGWLDRPGGHKVQPEAVPYLGGVAIVAAFAAVVLGGGLLLPIESGKAELLVLVGTGCGLALVGLIDDLRSLGPFVRLGAEVAAGAVVWRTGIGAQLVGAEYFDAVITVVWVVGVTNSFNLLDNMDGLSAGVAAIAALAFFAIGAANGQVLVATLAIAVAGCAIGFLRHNRHPARVYMGDAGSLFLGFMLAVIGIKLTFEGPRQTVWFVPILVVAVAVFDTSLVTVARLLHRRNPLTGGADHTSHRLVFLGLSVPVAVRVVYAGAALCGWLALALSLVDLVAGLMLITFVVAVGIGAGLALGAVPVYPTSRRRRWVVRELVPQDSAAPPSAESASKAEPASKEV
jgi:UDP-GlcNAc:undecaprenyl-phosphate GlcNAc-1-phosphate transferase